MLVIIAEEWPGPGLYTRRWGGDGQGAGAGMGGVSRVGSAATLRNDLMRSLNV